MLRPATHPSLFSLLNKGREKNAYPILTPILLTPILFAPPAFLCYDSRTYMRQPGEAAQRIRVRFGRKGEAAFISHLDLMRFWERALRRAGLPLAYSQGFTAHPRISIAAPLPLGTTSEAELVDIYMTRWIAPHSFLQAIRLQLPASIFVTEATAVPTNAPSLQSQVRLAEYRVSASIMVDKTETQGAIERLIGATTLMWQHTRDTGVRSYDLRPLVKELWLENSAEDTVVIGMVLRCDPEGSGRPDQVMSALGFTHSPREVHRVKLILEAPRLARK